HANVITRSARRARIRSRSGYSMFGVMIVLFVLSALMASIFRNLATEHLQLRRERGVEQCRWLVQSAAELAAVRLRRNAEYVGEVWQISAAELNGRHPAEVTIQIEDIDEDRSEHTAVVFVQAVYAPKAAE